MRMHCIGKVCSDFQYCIEGLCQDRFMRYTQYALKVVRTLAVRYVFKRAICRYSKSATGLTIEEKKRM